MTALEVDVIDAVRRILRAGISAAEAEPSHVAHRGESAAHEPRTWAAVTVEGHGSVTLLRGQGWAAWVLAALPAGTDPVLVAASQMLAQGLIPAAAPTDPFEVSFPDDDTSTPEPLPAWDAAVMDLSHGWRALVLLAVPAPGPDQVGELTGACRQATPMIRRHLPRSVSWSVACLPGPAREVYERAALIAARGASSRVELGHLGAALLLEPDLESATPLDGPLPDPAEGVLGLFTDARGRAVPEMVLRGRVSRALAAATVRPGDSGATTPVEGHGSSRPTFLDKVRSSTVPGVRLIAPPGPNSEGTGRGSATTADDSGVATATSGRHATAAVEVAAQLGRSDTPAVWLTGSRTDQSEVLDELAELGAAGRVRWLIGRHMIVIDPTAVAPSREERLDIDLTYQSIRLALAIDHTETRLGKHLIRAAVAAGVPTILLGRQWQPRSGHADLGSPPVVKVRPHYSEPPAVVDLLAPIADGLAALHQVTLAPGVLDAAATPAPEALVRRRNPFVEVPDFDLASAECPDPIDLGRARLDYACSRAALSPDRRVTPADIPTDPHQGIPAGGVGGPDPDTRFVGLLADQIIDQPLAVRTIGNRLMFAARWLRRTGPRATMLFAGPSGTGKTYSAGVIAAAYFGDPKALVRIDCGAMYDRHTINTLLGAPPAYVGYDDHERLLTTQITQHQGRCVVLFDEIEKADRRVLDILLGVLDSGLLTDLQQRTADASQSIFILTSNLGSDLFTRHTAGFTPQGRDQTTSAVHAEIRSHLRPELIDRLDAIVIYQPLTHAGITELTARHLTSLTTDLAAAGYHIDTDPDIVEHLAHHVETIGVRGLRRFIETALLRDLLACTPGRYQAAIDGDKVIWHPAE